MNKNYISQIAESKVKYHKLRAKMPYEEKFRIVLELQKIDSEMRKNNKSRNAVNSKCKVWHLDAGS